MPALYFVLDLVTGAKGVFISHLTLPKLRNPAFECSTDSVTTTQRLLAVNSSYVAYTAFRGGTRLPFGLNELEWNATGALQVGLAWKVGGVASSCQEWGDVLKYVLYVPK